MDCCVCVMQSAVTLSFPQRATSQYVKGGQDCWVDDGDCLKADFSTQEDCELAVHVVWSGTDANGNFMLSHGKRLSVFTRDALQDTVSL